MSMIPSPVTPERIEEIRKLHESATRGPYRVVGPTGYIYAADPYGHGDMHVAQVRGWGHLTGVGACCFDEGKAVAIQDANAAFFAEAWSAIRDLLSALSASQAALAAHGQAQGHGKMPENVSVGQREGGGVQIEGHTLAEDWELTLDADGNVELFDRVRVVYKLPAVPGAGAGDK